MKKLAVIDIGSNTVLVTGGFLNPEGKLQILFDHGEVARLSEGLQDDGLLQKAAKERVLKRLKEFREIANSHGVNELHAAGTAAFRRARDGIDFARQIEAELGISVRILSGDEEAYYSYQSAKNDFAKAGENLGMIDIGGGSTEYVFGEAGFKQSLPIGTVRFSEKFIKTHPIEDKNWNLLCEEIQNNLRNSLANINTIPKTWVAVAATPASLAAIYLKLPKYQPERIHGLVLKTKALEDLVEALRKKSLAQRIALPGMHPDRAELIPIGGAILVESLRFLGLEEVTISDRGLRYGLLQEALRS